MRKECPWAPHPRPNSFSELQKVSKFHPTELKTVFVYKIKLKMDQKAIKWTNKGWNIWKRGLGTKKTCFTQFLEHLEHLENPDSFEIIQKIGRHLENPDSFEIIRKIGNHLENPASFEIIPKIGSHLEKSGQFWNNPENWQPSGKSE